MQIHTLSRTIKNKKEKRVGRGGRHAKTSGRGGKGQTARAGNKTRPQMRDVIKKLPKLRGRGKNSNLSITEKPQVINLGVLEASFDAGTFITRTLLVNKSLVRRIQGVIPQVKILATGNLTKKFTISSECLISESAKKKITDVGGTIK